jgi:hypothetical protein
LPIGEICGGEPEPNPLRLGFVMSSVGDGGSALWYGVADRSLIVRSAIPSVRGSTTSDPLSSSSVAGVLLGPATVNGVMPSGGPAINPRSTCVLGLYGTLNDGSGGSGSDGLFALGGDGSTGLYYGGIVVALGPLL